MTEISQIVRSIEQTSKPFPEITDYPNEPGIYAFSLLAGSNLNNFGKSNQVIYAGIAKDSLRARDLGNHFRTGRTGSSTLRRSIGAVLKSELNLTARSRNGTSDRRAINNYIFEPSGDERLTTWMIKNLKVGYWKDLNRMNYKLLRDFELKIIKHFSPTLDLDARSKHLNPLATELDQLRNMCRTEAEIKL